MYNDQFECSSKRCREIIGHVVTCNLLERGLAMSGFRFACFVCHFAGGAGVREEMWWWKEMVDARWSV